MHPHPALFHIHLKNTFPDCGNQKLPSIGKPHVINIVRTGRNHVLQDSKQECTFICESPLIEKDAVVFRDMFSQYRA